MKKIQTEEQGEVESPCVKKCSLDENKICPECYRSIDEIVSWPYAGNLMRQKILNAANLRRDRIKK